MANQNITMPTLKRAVRTADRNLQKPVKSNFKVVGATINISDYG